jgi:hypothetical protein
MSGAPDAASVIVPDTTVSAYEPLRAVAVGLVASGPPEINPLSITKRKAKARIVIPPMVSFAGSKKSVLLTLKDEQRPHTCTYAVIAGQS